MDQRGQVSLFFATAGIVLIFTDRTIPLTEVVDAFEVFHTGQGAQGLMGKTSKQQLENAFGTSKDDIVVEKILTEGELQSAAVKDGYSTKNDSKLNHNTTSAGSSGGFGGR